MDDVQMPGDKKRAAAQPKEVVLSPRLSLSTDKSNTKILLKDPKLSHDVSTVKDPSDGPIVDFLSPSKLIGLMLG